MQTPLMCGLGLCFAAGIGGMFFPASALLHNVWMYGGLAVFSGLMVYGTRTFKVEDEDGLNFSLSL